MPVLQEQKPVKSLPLKDKSHDFAIRVVKLSQFLQKDKKEYVLSKQVLRCGTAVGALMRRRAWAKQS